MSFIVKSCQAGEILLAINPVNCFTGHEALDGPLCFSLTKPYTSPRNFGGTAHRLRGMEGYFTYYSYVKTLKMDILRNA